MGRVVCQGEFQRASLNKPNSFISNQKQKGRFLNWVEQQHMIKRLQQIIDTGLRHHTLIYSRAHQPLQQKVISPLAFQFCFKQLHVRGLRSGGSVWRQIGDVEPWSACLRGDCTALGKASSTLSAIMSTKGKETEETTTSAYSASRARAIEVTASLPMSIAWEQLYKEGVTPWDAKGVTPVISQLVQENSLREGMALVPGCGLGYDVVAMASPKRRIIGLDISKTAVEQAKALAHLSPNSEFVEFQVEDFFTYSPLEKFDFIFDYTFFCALSPDLRPEWAKKMAELLASEGELITLMFPIDEYEGGPPYAVSLDAYEKVLQPWNLKVSSVEANIPSIPSRKGCEKLVRWVRMTTNL